MPRCDWQGIVAQRGPRTVRHGPYGMQDECALLPLRHRWFRAARPTATRHMACPAAAMCALSCFRPGTPAGATVPCNGFSLLGTARRGAAANGSWASRCTIMPLPGYRHTGRTGHATGVCTAVERRRHDLLQPAAVPRAVMGRCTVPCALLRHRRRRAGDATPCNAVPFSLVHRVQRVP
jgi:hypothetical protein